MDNDIIMSSFVLKLLKLLVYLGEQMLSIIFYLIH